MANYAMEMRHEVINSIEKKGAQEDGSAPNDDSAEKSDQTCGRVEDESDNSSDWTTDEGEKSGEGSDKSANDSLLVEPPDSDTESVICLD